MMAGVGFPFNIGAQIGNGFAGTTSQLGIPGQGQSFQTLALPNSKLALYTLTIRAPSPSQVVVQSYTFPLSPSAVQIENTAMTNVWDVAGSPQQQGVQRIVDFYGDSPITILLDGTTGWQYHGTDGMSLTGMESILAVQALLAQFAILNKGQQSSNNPNLYTLEYYDYFSGNFWEVIPWGRQAVRQDQTRPLLFYYSFRLAGIRNIAAPPAPETNDPLTNTLSSSAPQAAVTLSASLTATLGGYTAVTAGALGVTI